MPCAHGATLESSPWTSFGVFGTWRCAFKDFTAKALRALRISKVSSILGATGRICFFLLQSLRAAGLLEVFFSRSFFTPGCYVRSDCRVRKATGCFAAIWRELGQNEPAGRFVSVAPRPAGHGLRQPSRTGKHDQHRGGLFRRTTTPLRRSCRGSDPAAQQVDIPLFRVALNALTRFEKAWDSHLRSARQPSLTGGTDAGDARFLIGPEDSMGNTGLFSLAGKIELVLEKS